MFTRHEGAAGTAPTHNHNATRGSVATLYGPWAEEARRLRFNPFDETVPASARWTHPAAPWDVSEAAFEAAS